MRAGFLVFEDPVFYLWFYRQGDGVEDGTCPSLA